MAVVIVGVPVSVPQWAEDLLRRYEWGVSGRDPESW